LRKPEVVRLSLLLVPLLALTGCAREPARPNVLIIAVDTLRPDHLSCYGYHRATSPHVDEMAGGGVLFENAISQAPWTLPSFASVFTSLYPTQHGATTVETMMRTTFPTLAGILSENGYATGAVVNAPVLRSDYGLNRGFGFYNEPPGEIERPADRVTREALEWIGDLEDRPFFAFVHYFDPHLAYAPPPPYDRLYDPGYEGTIGSSFDLDYFSSKEASVIREEINLLDAADRNHIVSLYDGEVAFTDQAVGDLLNGLGESGLDDNTLIVFLSDHGEEFFEHGGLDHGHSLYGELIRVPLVFRLPGGSPGGVRIARQVRLIDVAPTILDCVGINGEFQFEGVSLMGLMRGEDFSGSPGSGLMGPDFCLSEAMRRTNTVKSITSYPWKLIEDMASREYSLFNLESDPQEQDNLGNSEPAILSRLDALLTGATFAMSDTWFVEMAAGGEQHIFDVRISPEKGPVRVGFRLFRFLGPGGRTLDPGPAVDISTGRGLAVLDLSLTGSITLAFQLEQPNFPVKFELSLDGSGRADRVYLGDSLSNPESVPFIQKPNRRSVRSAIRPAAAPEPPYFHVWHSPSRYGTPVEARLNPETHRELRALGYVQ
jgi:arylsulfatase A-like enzyme